MGRGRFTIYIPFSEQTYPIPFGTFEPIIFQGSKVGYMLVPFPGGFTDSLKSTVWLFRSSNQLGRRNHASNQLAGWFSQKSLLD